MRDIVVDSSGVREIQVVFGRLRGQELLKDDIVARVRWSGRGKK